MFRRQGRLHLPSRVLFHMGGVHVKGEDLLVGEVLAAQKTEERGWCGGNRC